jgi:hypothetical protein
MEKQELPVYIYNTHLEAEAAIKSLSRSGFDIKKLSLIGKGYHSEEQPVGFYTASDRIKSWGALEGAVVVGGISVLGAALTEIGLPKDQVIKYEKALKVDKYLLMVHGDMVDLAQAHSVLATSKDLETV